MATSTCHISATLKESDARFDHSNYSFSSPKGQESVVALGADDFESACDIDQASATSKNSDQYSSFTHHIPANEISDLSPISSVSDAEFDGEGLQTYHHDRENLEFDSVRHIAPYNVTTAPAEAGGDYFMPWQNRTDLQRMGCLVVPPTIDIVMNAELFTWFHGLLPTLGGGVKSIIAQTQNDWTTKTELSGDKSFTPDSLDDLFSVNISGRLIIESPDPSVVPHIVITAAPPDDPWVACNNATNNPQDANFGHHLIVPSRLVEVINLPSQKWTLPMESPTICTLFAGSDEEDDSEDLPMTPTFRPGTPLPIPPGSSDDDSDQDFSLTRFSDRPDARVPAIDLSVSSKDGTIADRQSGPGILFAIDEDDEDLPPLDEWYQRWM